ncbi:hypothetical protein RM533_09355 [Croceicoccus sp. F390]|uniref:Uncharacterized protein n=1 Tax=Croceicoccus esteveae TaxID=3075597 RepID=A0ABU2ZK23_9SPHN|nr:hypothetical protein [Croceicoccus sp. F390]MDT0576393.1 hypothetical protein [Croceicoccus sp. F390]
MDKKPYSLDLGGSPWGEDCAKLGHTPGFWTRNRAEVALYRAGLLALYGTPPEGIELRSRANRHDFGTYHTLEAVVDPAKDDGSHAHYIEKVETGFERWLHAGFSPPDPGHLKNATQAARFINEAIRGAINTTRPLPGGSFFPDEFETLNTNLRSAFPEIAEAAIA